METSQRITRSVRKEDANNEWWVIDAAGMTVGRLSTRIASLLRGKHKADFTPHVDNGDFVVVVNADKVVFEGKRAEQKEYFRHSGYPGGVTIEKFQDIVEGRPDKVIFHSVRGMLPKNRLGRKIIKKLRVYAGAEHPHAAQQPQNYAI